VSSAAIVDLDLRSTGTGTGTGRLILGCLVFRAFCARLGRRTMDAGFALSQKFSVAAGKEEDRG
jgi:hypothetical protein